MARNYFFRAIIEPDKPKGFHGFVPALPGCHTFGNTVEDTRENLKEAILAEIETMAAHHIPIPKDQTIESLEQVEFDYAEAPCPKSKRTC